MAYAYKIKLENATNELKAGAMVAKLDGKDLDPKLVAVELKPKTLVVSASSPELDGKMLALTFVTSIKENKKEYKNTIKI